MTAAVADDPTLEALVQRIAELEERLAEADETLDAIRSGEVDALVVGSDDERRVFTLESADRPYRLLVEQMREGAVTLSGDGVILYCNLAFAALVGEPASSVVGSRFDRLIAAASVPVAPLLRDGGRTEILLRCADERVATASLSLSPLRGDDGDLLCGVVTDLTDARACRRARRGSPGARRRPRARGGRAARAAGGRECGGRLLGRGPDQRHDDVARADQGDVRYFARRGRGVARFL